MPAFSHNIQGKAPLNFRCPSCLNVLVVEPRLVGTAAPCPMCSAHIIAPKPVANGIPFAALVGAPTPHEATFAVQKTISSSSASKVILADCGISQSHIEKKNTSAVLKMAIFAVLTLAACLAAALILLRE